MFYSKVLIGHFKVLTNGDHLTKCKWIENDVLYSFSYLQLSV